MKRKLRTRILVGLIILTALCVFTLLYRQPSLELHTMSPINYQGKTVQLQVLAPSDWEEDPKPLNFTAFNNTHPTVALHPSARGSWLPEWLRRRFFKPPEMAAITVIAGLDDYHRRPEDFNVSRKEDTANGVFTAGRSINDGPGYHIIYFRSNRDEFEATYRQVCESFKVIQ